MKIEETYKHGYGNLCYNAFSLRAIVITVVSSEFSILKYLNITFFNFSFYIKQRLKNSEHTIRTAVNCPATIFFISPSATRSNNNSNN